MAHHFGKTALVNESRKFVHKPFACQAICAAYSAWEEMALK
jgi:hypothetical protein